MLTKYDQAKKVLEDAASRVDWAIAAADPDGGPQPGGEGDGVPTGNCQNGVPSGMSQNGAICPYCGAAFSCSSTHEPASYQVGVPQQVSANEGRMQRCMQGWVSAPDASAVPQPEFGGAPTEGSQSYVTSEVWVYAEPWVRRRLVIQDSRHGSWEFRRRLRGCE
jgi:hypothetical protein